MGHPWDDEEWLLDDWLHGSRPGGDGGGNGGGGVNRSITYRASRGKVLRASKKKKQKNAGGGSSTLWETIYSADISGLNEIEITGIGRYTKLMVFLDNPTMGATGTSVTAVWGSSTGYTSSFYRVFGTDNAHTGGAVTSAVPFIGNTGAHAGSVMIVDFFGSNTPTLYRMINGSTSSLQPNYTGFSTTVQRNDRIKFTHNTGNITSGTLRIYGQRLNTVQRTNTLSGASVTVDGFGECAEVYSLVANASSSAAEYKSIRFGNSGGLISTSTYRQLLVNQTSDFAQVSSSLTLTGENLSTAGVYSVVRLENFSLSAPTVYTVSPTSLGATAMTNAFQQCGYEETAQGNDRVQYISGGATTWSGGTAYTMGYIYPSAEVAVSNGDATASSGLETTGLGNYAKLIVVFSNVSDDNSGTTLQGGNDSGYTTSGYFSNRYDAGSTVGQSAQSAFRSGAETGGVYYRAHIIEGFNLAGPKTNETGALDTGLANPGLIREFVDVLAAWNKFKIIRTAAPASGTYYVCGYY